MSKQTKKGISVDVVIVGGNIVGATTALALQKMGFSVALLEKNQPKINSFKKAQPYALRVSAIIPVMKNFLSELGVWQRLLSERVQEVHKMEVWEKSVEHSLNFTQAQAAGGTHGSVVAWIVENDHIQHACWQLLDETSCLKIIGEWQTIEPLPTQENEQSPDYRLTIAVADQKQAVTLETKLLIAADGARSAVRQWSGILSTQKPYHQHCIVGNVRPTKFHQKTAWQRYHQGLAFAFLPLANGSCSIAWYVNKNESESLLSQSSEQQKQAIYQASGGMLGQIEKISRLEAFPIIRSDAHKLYGDSLLLVGDAVRTIHPMTGQGVNIGLCDVAVLSDIMRDASQHKIAINEPLLLRKYARKRSEYKLLQHGMDALNHFFKNQTIAPIRPKMLQQLNKFSAGKQLLTEVAMGYHTHLPNRLKRLY